MTGNQLPGLAHVDGLNQFRLSQFFGFDHRLGAQNGYIWDMHNLTGDYAPVLASRPPRWTVRPVAKPNGLYCSGKRFLVDGTALTVDGQEVGQVADSEKQMQGMSGRVVIWPDKLVYTQEGELEHLEASYSASGLVFGDGAYAGQEAEANSITTTGGAVPFRVGDAVSITGCTRQTENNKTPVIREISEDGKTLRFYENTFVLPEGEDSVTEPGEVTLARGVPDLDFLCANENRLWGCKGDTIYASKLGDPYNWNVFEGLSTDAWSVETGTPGDFTACCSFLGYPIFFKEDKVFKVYGDKPTNFQVMSSATLGVMAGSHKSLAVAGETLFYLARVGIVAYSGGIPRSIAAPFGDARYRNAVGGSDGTKYWVSMEDGDGASTLFCYDTQAGAWYKEDGTRLVATGYLDGLYALTDSALILLGRPVRVPEESAREEAVKSWVELGDITLDSFDSKYPVRLRLRLAAEPGVTIAAQIQYDSSGEWETAETVTAGRMTPFYLAFPARRCDHFRLKFSADGPWRLWSVLAELYDGPYVRK